MTAAQIYAALDRAGLTPPVHWHAAPPEWRTALQTIVEKIEDEMWRRVDAAEWEIEVMRGKKK